MFTTVTDSTPGGRYVADGVAASGTSTYYSSRMSGIVTQDTFGFELRTTGTLTGTFTLWYSNYDHPSETDDTDWIQDVNITMTQPAGAATKALYSVDGLQSKWYRIKYVNTSGTGSLYGRAVSPGDH